MKKKLVSLLFVLLMSVSFLKAVDVSPIVNPYWVVPLSTFPVNVIGSISPSTATTPTVVTGTACVKIVDSSILVPISFQGQTLSVAVISTATVITETVGLKSWEMIGNTSFYAIPFGNYVVIDTNTWTLLRTLLGETTNNFRAGQSAVISSGTFYQEYRVSSPTTTVITAYADGSTTVNFLVDYYTVESWDGDSSFGINGVFTKTVMDSTAYSPAEKRVRYVNPTFYYTVPIGTLTITVEGYNP